MKFFKSRLSRLIFSCMAISAVTIVYLQFMGHDSEFWKIYLNDQDLLVNSIERRQGMFMNETREMEMMLELLAKRHPFALTRYGDGEYYIMKGKKVLKHSQAYKKDHWSWDRDEPGVMGALMKNTLAAPKGVYFYGLPPQENWKEFKDEMLNISGGSIKPRFLTTSMIFRGETFDLFNATFLTPVFSGASISNPIILVINQKYRPHEERLKKIAVDIFFVPDDGPNFFEHDDNRLQFMKQISRFCSKYSHSTFLIAAGPMSEVVIHNMWHCDSSNQYVDIGRTLSQTLDQYLKD